MPILAPEEFASVRRAIDVTLGPATLPDEVVADPVYLGAAEDWATALYPDAPTATGADLDRVKRAVALYAAGLLAPAIPRLLSERLTDYEYRLADVDWSARGAALASRARDELLPLLGTAAAAAVPAAFFATAPGYRGRS